MTKAKAAPGLAHIAVEYGAGERAFEDAQQKLSLKEEDFVFIDASKYNVKAYELIHARLRENPATKKQVLKQLQDIQTAAQKLAQAFAEASTPTQEIMNRQARAYSVDKRRYDFDDAKYENMCTVISVGEALRNADEREGPFAFKSHGPRKHSQIVDEIADMIAADYFRLTGKEPGMINRAIGAARKSQEVTGKYADFFREIQSTAWANAGNATTGADCSC
jgi:hypothetical protein